MSLPHRRSRHAPIQVHIPKGMTLDAFLVLKEDAAIDEKIASKAKELEAVRQADQIKTRTLLSELTLPALPAGFQELLARNVEGIAED